MKFTIENHTTDITFDHVELERGKRYGTARRGMRRPVWLDHEFTGRIGTDNRQLIVVRHPAASAGYYGGTVRGYCAVFSVAGSGYDGCLLSFESVGGP